jgi:hypothetical protein
MKDIKNAMQWSYFQLDQSSMTTKGVEHKGQDPQDISFELLIKIREWRIRANICNQSKSLHDIRLKTDEIPPRYKQTR